MDDFVMTIQADEVDTTELTEEETMQSAFNVAMRESNTETRMFDFYDEV